MVEQRKFYKALGGCGGDYDLDEDPDNPRDPEDRECLLENNFPSMLQFFNWLEEQHAACTFRRLTRIGFYQVRDPKGLESALVTV